MTTQQLINGLRDLEQRNIPTDCILDMSPEIAAKLMKLQRLEEILHKKQGKQDYTIMRALLSELRAHDLTPLIELRIAVNQ